MAPRLIEKRQQGHKMVIFGAIFLLTTLLILYSSNSSNDIAYGSIHVVGGRRTAKTSNLRKTTDLKKWAGKEGYVSVYGNKSMTLHCGSCSLVTSSSHVLGTHAGQEVDSSDCVIRMNDAPTLGFQDDVGNRTTLRVVAHSSFFRVARRPGEFLNHTGGEPVVVFWGPPSKIGKDAKGTLYRVIQRVGMTYSNLSFFTITPSKMRKFDSLFQKETGRDRQKSQSWLSTGWFTMVLAIEICDNINVFGMVPPSHCVKKSGAKKMPYHYYKPRGAEECVTYIQNERGRRGNHHRFITEKQVFARWAKQYNITFTNPKW